MVHPVLAAVSAMGEALKSVADSNPSFMTTDEKTAALLELARLEARVAELRLRVLADAGDVAETTAARDAAGWLARETRGRFEDARADLRLAEALDRRYGVVAAALREGRANLAQARVVVRALDALPDTVGADVLAQAEEALVAHAAAFTPKELARLGRHVLDVVAPEVVEEAEGRRLADLEAEGRRRTRLVLRRLGDGTTRISGRVPDTTATRLAVYLDAYANPRRTDAVAPVEDASETSTPLVDQGPDPVARLPYPRRLGEAFCQLLETLDPGRLPVHGGDATTLIVTVPLATLRAELGTADLLGTSHIPHDPDAVLDAGDRLAAAHARRLACTAKIIPAVLGAASEVLDLGRARRLFTPPQRKALLIRDRTCRAEGCDIPGTWCEAHHLVPWQRGGSTDLCNGVLLCSHHHHRAHDPGYTTHRLASGDVRYTRRT